MCSLNGNKSVQYLQILYDRRIYKPIKLTIMKKYLAVTAVVGSLLFLSSCTKDWVCECTVSSGSSSYVYEETIEASSLSKASEECQSKDESTFGDCKLKP